MPDAVVDEDRRQEESPQPDQQQEDPQGEPLEASESGSPEGQPETGGPLEAETPPTPRPRPPQREEPKAPVHLDERAQRLEPLLRDALQAYQPELGAAVDQVVVRVPLEHLVEAAQVLKEDPRLDFNYFRCLATVDYEEYFELVYILYSTTKRHQVLLKTTCPYEAPSAPSLIPLWRAADWFERESHDLFGVVFEGHPNLKPLLLYEGFEGYPGRKSFPFHQYEDW